MTVGLDMSVRGVEIMDNTTPASLNLDIFDVDTIQRFTRYLFLFIRYRYASLFLKIIILCMK